VPAPAGTVTAIEPLGGPQELLVVAAVAFSSFVLLIVTVSKLISCVAGSVQEEKVVLI
jgi:hypothetical protein